MRTESLRDYLFSFPDINHARYRSPAADITLFASRGALAAVLFNLESGLRLEICERIPACAEGMLKSASEWLDRYFHSGGSGLMTVTSVDSHDPMLSCTFTHSSSGDAEYSLSFDVSRFSRKERTIYAELLRIPQGETVSYADLAARAGFPRAARFAGNAMAKNMFPIFIPCHRVIRSDRSMGQYTGGIGIKRYLLEHERASFFAERKG